MDEKGPEKAEGRAEEGPGETTRASAAPSMEEIEARLQSAFERAKGFAASEADDENDAQAARLERLEASIHQGTGLKMPAPDETELDGTLREVEAKVRGAQQSRARQEAESDRIRRADQATARGLGTGLSLAYVLIGLPIAGSGLGWVLDKATGGNVWLPLFAILGMVAAIWWTIRTTNRLDKP